MAVNEHLVDDYWCIESVLIEFRKLVIPNIGEVFETLLFYFFEGSVFC